MTISQRERIKLGNDELFAKGNFNFIDELFSTNYIVHAGRKDYKGHGFIRRFIEELRSAIPDIRVVEVEFLTESGDTITWQRTLSGTHKANMMGIKPSGQKVEWRDMIVSRFIDEKIIEEWTVSELATELLSKPPRA